MEFHLKLHNFGITFNCSLNCILVWKVEKLTIAYNVVAYRNNILEYLNKFHVFMFSALNNVAQVFALWMNGKCPNILFIVLCRDENQLTETQWVGNRQISKEMFRKRRKINFLYYETYTKVCKAHVLWLILQRNFYLTTNKTNPFEAQKGAFFLYHWIHLEKWNPLKLKKVTS